MLRRRTAIIVVATLFTAALLLSLFTHSTGVVRNDPARNIWIPPELTMPVELQVAYNNAQIFFHYRWPARQPHLFTDLLRYSQGKWQRQLDTPNGSDPDGIYEDRLAMMVDEGEEAFRLDHRHGRSLGEEIAPRQDRRGEPAGGADEDDDEKRQQEAAPTAGQQPG